MLTECMAVIAGAWAPNVIWCLRVGPRRFNELKIDIPPVSAKVLSTRLAELTERGVVVKVGHKLKAKGHLPVKG